MDTKLSKQSQAFLHRLIFDSNYDCREEVEGYAQDALDRGVSIQTINSTLCTIIREGMVRNVQADVIQHAVEIALKELEVQNG